MNGLADAFMDIFKKEGPLGFYKGFIPISDVDKSRSNHLPSIYLFGKPQKASIHCLGLIGK